MKIGLYGLPCSGKTTLMKKLESSGYPCIYGSECLKKMAKERFNTEFDDLSEEDKLHLRLNLPMRLPKDIIVDGHYSFYESGKQNIVMTESDLYDAYVYLDTNAETIKERINASDKNERFKGLSVDEIQTWKDFELDGLLQYANEKNRTLLIVSEADAEAEQKDLIVRLFHNDHSLDAYSTAKSLAAGITVSSDHIVLSDCDKTISYFDSGAEYLSLSTDPIWTPSDLKKNFNHDRYSILQFERMFHHIVAKDHKRLINEIKKIHKNDINEKLLSWLTEKGQLIGLTSGFSEVYADWLQVLGWRYDSQYYVSSQVKYFICKELKKHAYVSAVGDSAVDLPMLLCADQGYVVAYKKLNKKLDSYFKGNETDIIQIMNTKQPEIQYDGLKRRIYDI